MKKLLAIAMALILPMIGMAQVNINAKGSVYMLNSLPVQNVTITSAKTGNTAISDTSGYFFIETCDKDILTIDAPPFMQNKLKIKYNKKKGTADAPDFALNFERKKSVLKQIIDKNYLDSKYYNEALFNLHIDKDYTKYADIETCIQTEFPSLRMEGGQLLSATAMSSTDYMLIIIDNQEASSINEIQLNAIEKMYVLKANQAAIYGPAAKNDVLVVKYKGGSDYDLDE